MPELVLRLRLIDSVVVSERAATVGEHRTVTRLPGSLLLGACSANKQYEHARSFDFFHSGAVRFGDGLPEIDDAQAMPLPLSLHRVKAQETYYNLAEPPNPRPNEQLEQVRGHYVDRKGDRVFVETEYAMRTAVDADGRASNGLLFGYEAISAGQSFLSRVQADDDELIDLVRARLAGKIVRLGKSKGAEHGRVEVSVATIADWSVEGGFQGTVKIWCTSDLALRDSETGAPRVLPHAADFGLAGYCLDPSRSFLRTRKWSPFNGKRARPDLERQVLAAGSVLVFTGGPPVDIDRVRSALKDGIGEYRADGLGRALIQPKLLDRASFGSSPRAKIPNALVAADPPADELGAWLKDRLTQAAWREDAWQLADAWVKQMSKYDRVPASQWGVVRTLAAQNRVVANLDAFRMELKTHLGRRTTIEKWKQSKSEMSASSALLKLIGSEEDALSKVLGRSTSTAAILPAIELLRARMVRASSEKEDRRG